MAVVVMEDLLICLKRMMDMEMGLTMVAFLLPLLGFRRVPKFSLQPAGERERPRHWACAGRL